MGAPVGAQPLHNQRFLGGHPGSDRGGLVILQGRRPDGVPLPPYPVVCEVLTVRPLRIDGYPYLQGGPVATSVTAACAHGWQHGLNVTRTLLPA